MQHSGQFAFITGGASGIGRALALELGRRGATVVVSDRDLAGAQDVARNINRIGPGQAEPIALDVTDGAAVGAAVETACTRHGRLDLMFNNAGIAISGDARDLTIEHWRRVVEVNFMGVVHGAAVAYRLMAAQGSGHIVNIASLAGLLPFPGNAPYCATKHAVVGLSHALRAEGEALGVRVSAVCPGFIATNIFAASEAVNVSRERLAGHIPFATVSADEAAVRILAGVAANRAVIVFPTYARVAWWLFRLVPGALAPLGQRMMRDFRKLRGAG